MSLSVPVLDRPVFDELPQVEAELTYLIAMASKPVNYTYEPPSGIPQHNSSYQTHKLPIYSARAIAQNLSLDREGFAFAVHNSKVHNFYDQDEIRSIYYPEAEQLLKEVTGATNVLIFDHTLRNAQRKQLS